MGTNLVRLDSLAFPDATTHAARLEPVASQTGGEIAQENRFRSERQFRARRGIDSLMKPPGHHDRLKLV
jgi:hypothetical protein